MFQKEAAFVRRPLNSPVDGAGRWPKPGAKLFSAESYRCRPGGMTPMKLILVAGALPIREIASVGGGEMRVRNIVAAIAGAQRKLRMGLARSGLSRFTGVGRSRRRDGIKIRRAADWVAATSEHDGLYLLSAPAGSLLHASCRVGGWPSSHCVIRGRVSLLGHLVVHAVQFN